MINDRIREDDRKVMDCVNEYGSLRLDQVREYMKNLDEASFERTLHDLKKRRYLHVNQGIVSIDGRSQLDDKMVRAFWVFLRVFKNAPTIRHNTHCHGPHITQIFFMKDNSEFQIVVFDEDDMCLVNMLLKNQHMNYLKYIIVVSKLRMAKEVLQRCRDMGMRNEITFAVFTARKEDRFAIRFIRPESEGVEVENESG